MPSPTPVPEGGADGRATNTDAPAVASSGPGTGQDSARGPLLRVLSSRAAAAGASDNELN